MFFHARSQSGERGRNSIVASVFAAFCRMMFVANASRSRGIYDDFPEVLRARDNIAGEIGEYFAIKALNNSEKNTVLRLSSGLKDIDAIQTGNGTTYAIKTIGKIPQTTSNIWAKERAKAVDYFVIALLRHESLSPNCVLKISSRKAALFLKRDNYQSAWKLQINERFVRLAKLLQGNIPFNGE